MSSPDVAVALPAVALPAVVTAAPPAVLEEAKDAVLNGLSQLEVGDPAESVLAVAESLRAASGNNFDNVHDILQNYVKNNPMVFDDPAKKLAPGGDAADADDEMWAQLKKNEFFFATHGSKGNPMAGQWQRFMSGSAQQATLYNSSQGRLEKAKLRANWCKLKYDVYSQSKTFTQMQSEGKTVDGHYYSVHKIAMEEGGGEAGARAASCYAVWAMKLGGTWVTWDEWTQQLKFMYTVVGHKERMEKAWCKRQCWRLNVDEDVPTSQEDHRQALADGRASSLAACTPKSEPEAPSTPHVGTPSVGTPRREVAQAAQVSPRAEPLTPSKAEDAGRTPPIDTPPGATPKAPKRKVQTELQVAMTDVKKIKTELGSVMSQANTIVGDIAAATSESTWGFAKHESICGDLKKTKGVVDSMYQEEAFIHEVCTVTQVSELKLKSGRPESELVSHVNKLVQTLQPQLHALRRECDLLKAQHSARTAVGKAKGKAKPKRAAATRAAK